jgi:dTDP-4-dehydrorhamnose 3,5-epimerase
MKGGSSGMHFSLGRIDGVVITPLIRNVDERGCLIETFRADMLPGELLPAMSYLSLTEPGAARGPHEHIDQTDIFAFPGPGSFRIVLWDGRDNSPTAGNKMVVFGGADNPLSVIVPPRVVHAYSNISQTERGLVLNYPNKLYAGPGRGQPVDEIRHEATGDEFYKDFLSS